MHNNELKNWLPADWSAPAWIHAGTTTRTGGFSSGPFDSFNLATHVGDIEDRVISNRKLLNQQLKLKNEPCWLKQIHSNHVINLDDYTEAITADGSYTNNPDKICVVMTADCLPVLLCNTNGTAVAAIHVGWRGFSQNIIGKATKKFTDNNNELMAWLGPSISKAHYEIDSRVYDAAINIFKGADDCFFSTRPDHWQMDLKQLARKQLTSLGVSKIYTSSDCTYSKQSCYYSHRRDGTTGRMASMIWIDSRHSMN